MRISLGELLMFDCRFHDYLLRIWMDRGFVSCILENMFLGDEIIALDLLV